MGVYEGPFAKCRLVGGPLDGNGYNDIPAPVVGMPGAVLNMGAGSDPHGPPRAVYTVMKDNPRQEPGVGEIWYFEYDAELSNLESIAATKSERDMRSEAGPGKVVPDAGVAAGPGVATADAGLPSTTVVVDRVFGAATAAIATSLWQNASEYPPPWIGVNADRPTPPDPVLASGDLGRLLSMVADYVAGLGREFTRDDASTLIRERRAFSVELRHFVKGPRALAVGLLALPIVARDRDQRASATEIADLIRPWCLGDRQLELATARFVKDLVAAIRHGRLPVEPELEDVGSWDLGDGVSDRPLWPSMLDKQNRPRVPDFELSAWSAGDGSGVARYGEVAQILKRTVGAIRAEHVQADRRSIVTCRGMGDFVGNMRMDYVEDPRFALSIPLVVLQYGLAIPNVDPGVPALTMALVGAAYGTAALPGHWITPLVTAPGTHFPQTLLALGAIVRQGEIARDVPTTPHWTASAEKHTLHELEVVQCDVGVTWSHDDINAGDVTSDVVIAFAAVARAPRIASEVEGVHVVPWVLEDPRRRDFAKRELVAPEARDDDEDDEEDDEEPLYALPNNWTYPYCDQHMHPTMDATQRGMLRLAELIAARRDQGLSVHVSMPRVAGLVEEFLAHYERLLTEKVDKPAHDLDFELLPRYEDAGWLKERAEP